MVNVNCGACGHLNSRGHCNLTACIFPCSFGTGGYINKPITNADRIRSMTDEELAKWLNQMQTDAYNRGMLEDWIFGYPNNYDNWLGWLKEEADHD